MPFNPTDELDMRFSVSEWNTILGQLQEGPYKITAPLINKINLQAARHEQEAAKAQQPPQSDVKAEVSYVNGEMQSDEPLLGMPRA